MEVFIIGGVVVLVYVVWHLGYGAGQGKELGRRLKEEIESRNKTSPKPAGPQVPDDNLQREFRHQIATQYGVDPTNGLKTQVACYAQW